MKKFDFSGYATKNDLRCSDGRIIRQGAFKEDDGTTVPLVWNHKHDAVSNILGHADLENRPDGVYAYCSLNNTEQGQMAKELLKHGDIKSLSIFANKLQQRGSEVLHGCIREVSLVLAGANPGAYIEDVVIAHSEDGSEIVSEDEAYIYTGTPLINGFGHADEEDDMDQPDDTETETSDDETVEDVFNTLTDKQKNVVYYLIGQAVNGDEEIDEEVEETEETFSHADEDGETVEDVFNTLSEKQKQVVYYLIGQAIEENGDDVDEEEVDEEEEVIMKHNIFDSETEDNTISHSEIMAAINEAETTGTMKASFIKHGIEDIDILFPEAKAVTPTPDMITRQMGWVTEVLNATKKSPFSRIKSVAANLTEDEARAKGYIKGKEKAEEKFGLLKRVTTPQTIYKKQALDRDDIIDITDFDVVAWLKAEMRMMLDEELARAILVGDGRSKGHNDKINEENIRPIYQDDDLYTIHYEVNVADASDENELSAILIDSAIRARKEYRGTGNPVFYAATDTINDMLLARDKIGHRLYGNETELAAALRVSKIVEVPVLEGIKRTDDETNKFELLGLIVNLADYTIGADKGGEVNFFDDFDIDFNKEKYLLETRCSGALTHPYSAIALEKKDTSSYSMPTGSSIQG